MNRREFFFRFGILTGLALTTDAALAHRHPRLRRRLRIRRRIRRHAFTRMILGRPFWVVPVGLVVGWELFHDNRVVVVKETRIIERDGSKVEVAVVQDTNGNTEQIDIVREDTSDNSKNLEGSKIDKDDKATPGVDAESES